METIGRIIATEKQPSTIEEFTFWTQKDLKLKPFDVVVVDHIKDANGEDSKTFGVVEEISHMTDSPSALAGYISSDFGDVDAHTYTERIGMNYVKCKVVGNDKGIYIPVQEGKQVHLADEEQIMEALGLKDVKKMGIAQRELLDKAIHMAVEDLYSSVLFLRDNAEELGIDTDNIVLAGSSAGAITVLQADYEQANRTPCAQVLPEDFHFAGVMSFAGAIYSTQGPLKYSVSAPAPTLLLHGTADKLVNYDQIVFFNIGWFGSNRLAERFGKLGYPYTFLRFKDHGHEIAMSMPYTVEVQKEFILTCVLKKVARTLDVMIDDPRIEAPEIWKKGPEELYK